MNICICGGGNLGHTTAGYISAKDNYHVSIFTRHPEKWKKELKIVLPNGNAIIGNIDKISNDPEDVVPSADIVLICLPGMYIHDEIEKIKPFLKQQTVVGSVVSSTGFFFQAHELIPNQPLFGFQRVPFISRIIEYGHKVHLLGFKSSLKVVIENSNKKEKIRTTLADMIDTPVSLLDNFYDVSLSNSNPLLHTSRLYTMWKDWHEGIYYPSSSLFYEDWTVEAAQLYIDMDNEFQKLLRLLGVKEDNIPSVLKYYESHDAKSLCDKIRSIKAFKGIKSPMIKTTRGWVPDISSRYFSEDFGYGLKFIYQLVNNKVNAPHITKVYNWGLSIMSK